MIFIISGFDDDHRNQKTKKTPLLYQRRANKELGSDRMKNRLVSDSKDKRKDTIPVIKKSPIVSV